MLAKAKYLSVGALSAYLKRKFDADPHLEKVYLTGEISNLGNRRGRHLYFSIKDPDGKAVIKAAMFSYANRLKFNPEEGMKIFAIGRVQIYEPSGTYSIILEEMTPDGVGELYLAYEELKKKLYAEGLFSQEKRALPLFPKKIAVITSPTGAVIEDIAKTAQRRFPSAQVVLYPAVVQGDGAVPSILKQLERVAAADYDVLIIGRGGGSIEDLWAFNDEKLVRAVAAMPLPVISSVGHETDNTLTDLVADRRAATPTAAAELATPVTLQQLTDRLAEINLRLEGAMRRMIRVKKEALQSWLARPIMRQPDRLYTAYQEEVDRQYERMVRSFKHQVDNRQQGIRNLIQRQQRIGSNLLQPYQERFSRLTDKLNLVSPLTILSHGYAIVEKEDRTVIQKSKDLKAGDAIALKFADGEATAEVKGVKND
ncbi:exodeoxyribonuclease VII large subunit [Eupransor demetentiae]|uniref:Exodeoxyribonuclease 7 large subunit n=1 Tax=Eupransor demetentiae TaxID=3109584 RepID=A0ABP0EMX3_9LACO|nr:Exonuclease VII [Lactobacillaceae bacterium LMG 33000]